MESLNNEDWEMIKESLKYTKLRFEEYDKYPSQEFKQKRIDEINALIIKVKKVQPLK